MMLSLSVVPVQSDRTDVSVEQVRNAFKKLNQRSATGPDNLSALILKTFAEELAPVWQPMFQCSTDTHVTPEMWKTSDVVPLPKKTCLKEPVDYRPGAVTSVLMKALERLLVQHLTQSVDEKSQHRGCHCSVNASNFETSTSPNL